LCWFAWPIVGFACSRAASSKNTPLMTAVVSGTAAWLRSQAMNALRCGTRTSVFQTERHAEDRSARRSAKLPS
jgi:hypothetical protein